MSKNNIPEKNIFKFLIGRQVKALYSDEGKSKKVIGLLKEVTDKYIIVNDVVVGLGDNFIACIPIKDSSLNCGK